METLSLWELIAASRLDLMAAYLAAVAVGAPLMAAVVAEPVEVQVGQVGRHICLAAAPAVLRALAVTTE